MPSKLGLAAPIIAGLAVGVIFVVFFSLYLSSNPFHFQVEKPYQFQNSEYSSKWIALTRGLEEVRAFMEKFPTANTTVYRNVRIVDYSAFESESSKVADLRIVIGLDNNSIFSIHLECGTVDSETSEIARASIKEAHGQRISEISQFLMDNKCPQMGRNSTVAIPDINISNSTVVCHDSLLCTYELKTGNNTYPINFRFNGTITSMTIDEPTQTLMINIKTNRDGSLQVALPRGLIDSRIGENSKSGADQDFAVFVDTMNVDANEYTSTDVKWAKTLGITDNPENYRILQIAVREGTETVEIVATIPL